MSNLRELYQELILDHNKNPRNFGRPPHPTHEAHGYNPLCGDRVTVYLSLDGDRVEDVRFEGKGCAISTASASMMTQMLKGKTVAECDAIFSNFHDLVTGKSCPVESLNQLGKLAVFGGVRDFPARVKCATLAWHTVQAALHGQTDPVSTE
ncbi:MAG: SUF system NifU family Fe-S cluster assembly protein [Candidatus Sumerlaeaceae bacterium]|nr:SUF system NifU family Fe-S cluster assembly protein [Candidatus Sumerlaeaceae bacterium]